MAGAKICSLLPPVLLLGLTTGPAWAAENEDTGSMQEGPSIEFLEFLGQWETDEGEWIPPADLIEGDFAQLLNVALPENPTAGSGDNNDGNTSQTDEPTSDNDQSNS